MMTVKEAVAGGRIDVCEMRCQGFFDSAMSLSSQLRNHNAKQPLTLGANVFSKQREFGTVEPEFDILDDWRHFGSTGPDGRKSTSKGSLKLDASLDKLLALSGPSKSSSGTDLNKFNLPMHKVSNAMPGSTGQSSDRSASLLNEAGGMRFSYGSMPEKESDHAHSDSRKNSGKSHQPHHLHAEDKSAQNPENRGMKHDASWSSGCGKLPPRSLSFQSIGEDIDDDTFSVCWNPHPAKPELLPVYKEHEEEEILNEEQLEAEIEKMQEECMLYGQWLQEFDPQFSPYAVHRHRLF